MSLQVLSEKVTSSSTHNFRSQVGIGSNSQALFRDCRIIRLTSFVLAGGNSMSVFKGIGCSTSVILYSEAGVKLEVMSLLIASILLTKMSLKSCASISEDLFDGKTSSFVLPRRWLMILNKLF